jgi:hypothetical protein
MAIWDQFQSGALPYQEYWLPLLIGMVAGTLCIFVGNLVWRGKKRKLTPIRDHAVPVNYDPFLQGSQSDQRRAARRAGNPIEVFYTRLGNQSAAKRALVLDRSLGGLRLCTDEEIGPGMGLNILPVNASTLIPWVEVEVRECRPVDDSWELHCRFIKTPPWSVLLLFG